MKNLQAHLPELEADTQVVGVSMDSPFANKAFADKEGIKFPIASDWFNNGSVTKEIFGIYSDKYKAGRRVNYLIGKNGKVLEVQDGNEAIDPTKIVDACKARRLKE
ncbi:MAG: redoxin domain-containing protein [Candidatus Koribacter versatilis]|uniref:Redoxin domain-containing protein n=1 Tax=Candidatus Korobacter versatilis TaxID=658062 RepID=A0A932A923_9BACT|nr:redoxin domain-containing protein [Candidatus Koribacter versatilis]